MAQPSYQPGFSKGTELIIPLYLHLYLYMYAYKIWDLLDWFKDYGSRSPTMTVSQWKD